MDFPKDVARAEHRKTLHFRQKYGILFFVCEKI